MVLAAQFESLHSSDYDFFDAAARNHFGMFRVLVTGQTVNIFSGLGLLLLFGVVKKNASCSRSYNRFAASRAWNVMTRYPGESRSLAPDFNDHDPLVRHDAVWSSPSGGAVPTDRLGAVMADSLGVCC